MTVRRTCFALAAACSVALGLMAPPGTAAVGASAAPAATGTASVRAAAAPTPVRDPDRVSTTPAGWGWHTNVSPSTMTAFVNQGNRITDLEVNTASGTPTFSAAYVGNSGSYQRTWWWYYGKTGSQVSQLIGANGARILDLEPYVVNGAVRYAVVMVKNSGAANKAWGWYTGTTLAQIGSYASNNNMRLIDSDRFKVGGTTRYSAVFVRNAGVDRASWWHYYGLSAASVASRLSTNKARLTNLERNADGTLDVIMTKGDGFSGSWWYLTGRTSAQVTAFVNQVGGRIFHVDSRVVSGSRFYDVLILDNTPTDTRRIRNLVSSRMTGTWGFYVKKVNGPVVNGLNADTKFEPASMMKIVHAVTALRDVQSGNRTVDSLVPWRQHPSFPARYRSDAGFYSSTEGVSNAKDVCAYDNDGNALGTPVNDKLGPIILDYMLKDSDNRATDAIVNLYGFSGLNATIDAAGMTRSRVYSRIGCPGEASPVAGKPNELTLSDAGRIYEGVERLQLLDSTRRANLYTYLGGGAPGGALLTMINAEATAAGLTAAEREQFVAGVSSRSKPGGYGFCLNNACSSTRNISSSGGIMWLPVKGRGGAVVKSAYVFGRWFDVNVACTFDTIGDDGCAAYENEQSGYGTIGVEMFRAAVKQALATW